MQRKRSPKSSDQSATEMAQLREELAEARETLEAIRSGAVDGLIVVGYAQERVFSLEGVETPYRSLIETMNEGALLLQKDGQIIYANRRFARMAGRSIQEVTGKSWNCFFSSKEHSRLAELLSVAGANGARGEFTLVDGVEVVRYVQISLSLVNSGSNATYAVIVTDLSERKQWEARLLEHNVALEQSVAERTEALAKSEERMALAFNAAQDGIWDWNLETDEVYYSSRWKTMLGYEDSEIETHVSAWKRLLHPDDLPRTLHVVSDVLEGKADYGMEFRMRHKDGHYVDILSRGFPVPRGPNGQIVRIVGTHSDLTDRKRAEVALREAKERLDLVLQSCNIGMWEFDLATQTTTHTLEHDRIYGYDKPLSQWTYEVFLEHVIPEDRARVAEVQHQAFKNRCSWTCEYRIRRPDGQIRWILTSGAHLDGADVTSPHVAGIVQDITARRQMQEKLREAQEEKFRAIFDGASDGILLANMKTRRFASANASICQMLGYTPEEFMALGVEDIHPSQDLAWIVKEFDRMVQGDGIAMLPDLPVRRKDGSIIHASLGTAIVTQDGANFIAGFFRDITERKHAEAALMASESRYRLLVNNLPVAVMVMDNSYKIVLANHAAATLVKASGVEALVGRSAFDFVLRGDQPQAMDRAVELSEHGIIPPVERQFQCMDGSSITVETRAVTISGADGNQVGSLGIAEDITERKRVQQNLQLLATMLDVAPVAVMIHDAEGRIFYTNRMASQVYGYTPEEFQQMYLRQLLSSEKQESITDRIRTILATGRGEFEVLYRRKDGSSLPLHIQARPVEWNGMASILSVQTDLTETKKAEYALRQAEELRQGKEKADAANRAKSVFLANMSHEIRTPMNAILGFSQLLLRDPELADNHRQQVTTIIRSGEHLLHIINDILEMARIESGQVALHPARFNLPLLLDDLERLFSLRAQAKNLTFRVKRREMLPRIVVTDETKLRQVLINLLGNAFKFTPRGGEITLRLGAETETDGRLCLWGEVTDTGPGISAEDLERLFKPFMQTEAGRQMAGGTGLGLAISREFTHQMDGELTVRSQVGEGSTFRFEVRVRPGDERAFPVDAGSVRRVLHLLPGQGACRVLVADDQAENRDLLVLTLSPLGFEVQTAEDGAQAVAVCQAWSPQVVLLDLRMPGMDGYEAARRIRSAHGAGIKIIAVSASVFTEHRERALASGVDTFIGKPFKEEELLERIQQLTGVEYIYDDSRGAEATAAAEELPTAGEMERLPAELVLELQELLTRAQYDKMLVVVERIAERDARLGERLRHLVKQYDYANLQMALSLKKRDL